MTIEQIKLHTALMDAIRSQFLKLWHKDIIPALHDSDIFPTKKQLQKAQHNLWQKWRRGECHKYPLLFIGNN